MAEERMCYVAADPAQPGAAWAAAVDEPRFAKDNAEEVASWIKSGASVMRVPASEARAMLMKWEHPDEKKTDTSQLSLI